jgi:hypothetical protein
MKEGRVYGVAGLFLTNQVRRPTTKPPAAAMSDVVRSALPVVWAATKAVTAVPRAATRALSIVVNNTHLLSARAARIIGGF